MPDCWIFGYGSLVWKAGFAYEERVVGYIKGYKRRFWQGSTDHRGVPEKPGRVVTLIPSKEEDGEEDRITWGVAYRVHEDKVEEVKSYLDYREKGGYTVDMVDVFNQNDHLPVVEKALVYIGTETNPNYLGPAPAEEIAKQIFSSEGPSGHNREYLFHLCEALRELSPQYRDSHLCELEELVKKLIEKN